MSNVQTYEVRVAVKRKGSRHFSSHVGMYIEYQMVKLFHQDARTGNQAMRKCEKYGRPLSARKVDGYKGVSNTQRLTESLVKNPYPNAIAMDEFVWQRKAKRAERLETKKNDKPIELDE